MAASSAVAGIVTVLVLMIVAVSAGAFIMISQSQTTHNLTVVETNVTVHGTPAFLGLCEAIAASCPFPIGENYTLTVDLIRYKGTLYYSYTGTINLGGLITMTSTDSSGGLLVTTISSSRSTLTYTAWFTNSSLYCVSPAGYWNTTCPV